jgi:hypothetical protein
MKKYIYGILSLFPFIFLCYFAASRSVNIPYWDNWEFFSLLQGAYDGQLRLYDFWGQQNEHRVVFPWLLKFFTALITRWNIHYETALSVLLGTGIYALLAFQIGKLEIFNTSRRSVIYLAVSILVFSIAQAESWLPGEQVQTFLNIFSFSLGIFLLAASADLSFKRYSAALMCGAVANYSMGNGILFWPLSFLLLLERPLSYPRRKMMLKLWAIIAPLILGSYLFHYQSQPHHPALTFALRHPVESWRYFLTFLGSPLSLGTPEVAEKAGFFSLLLSVLTVYYGRKIFYKSTGMKLAVLPWFGLAIYSLSSALLITFARVGFGVNQALSLRYIPFSNLLWISLMVLTGNVLVCSPSPLPGIVRKISQSKVFHIACLIVFLLLTSGPACIGWDWGTRYAGLCRLASNYLLADFYDDYFFKRYLYPADLHRQITALKKLRLSLFHDAKFPVKLAGPVPVQSLPASANDITYYIDKSADNGTSFFMRGWAAINGEDSRQSVISIVLQSNATHYVIPTIPERRQDVTDWFHRIRNYDHSGFIVNIPKIGMQQGEYRVKIRIKKGRKEVMGSTPLKFRV